MRVCTNLICAVTCVVSIKSGAIMKGMVSFALVNQSLVFVCSCRYVTGFGPEAAEAGREEEPSP